MFGAFVGFLFELFDLWNCNSQNPKFFITCPPHLHPLAALADIAKPLKKPAWGVDTTGLDIQILSPVEATKLSMARDFWKLGP